MTNQVLTSEQPKAISNLRSYLHVGLASNAGASALIARIGLAAVMFPHGAQKALGWFGGHGWGGTYGFFTQHMGLPGIVAASVILIEFFGPILLLLGIAVRPIALAFVGLMIGTIVTVHGEHGFFMNWYGNQEGEGIEYALLMIALAASLVASGAGILSLDNKLAQKLQ